MLTSREKVYIIELMESSLESARDDLETSDDPLELQALQREVKMIRSIIAKLM